MKSLDGRWQFNLLNSSPDEGPTEFELSKGKILSADSGVSNGTFEVDNESLKLFIQMPSVQDEEDWRLFVRFPLAGALRGEYMLGVAEAEFPDGLSIVIAECSFHRVRGYNQ